MYVLVGYSSSARIHEMIAKGQLDLFFTIFKDELDKYPCLYRYEITEPITTALTNIVGLRCKPGISQEQIQYLPTMLSWIDANQSKYNMFIQTLGVLAFTINLYMKHSNNHLLLDAIETLTKWVWAKRRVSSSYVETSNYNFQESVTSLKALHPEVFKIVNCLPQTKRAITSQVKRDFKSALNNSSISSMRDLGVNISDKALVKALFKKPDVVLMFLDQDFCDRIKKIAERMLADRTAQELKGE